MAQPLGETYANVPSVAIDQSRLVIYRPRVNSDKAGVISVYLNGKYHTSLQPDAYTEVCLTTTQAQLRLRRMLADGNSQPELDSDGTLALKRGDSLYLRLSALNNGRTRMDIRPTSAALQDLRPVRLQQHVVSRVPDVKPCKQEQSLVVAFGAVVEFSPQQAALTPDGEQELQQMVDKINVRYKTAKSIQVNVVGYANDSAEEFRNSRLSLERAQAVSDYLINKGLSKESLALEAKGSQKNKAQPAPSVTGRRVEITVSVEIR